MCGSITIDEYLEGLEGHTVIAQYTKDGNRAITVRDPDDDVLNVYTESGSRHQYFWGIDYATPAEQEADAHAVMTSHGFTLVAGEVTEPLLTTN